MWILNQSGDRLFEVKDIKVERKKYIVAIDSFQEPTIVAKYKNEAELYQVWQMLYSSMKNEEKLFVFPKEGFFKKDQ